MKKELFVVICCFAICSPVLGQSIDRLITAEEAEKHLSYISSDEMMGRDTGSPGIEKAANYIVEQLKKYGVKPLPDKEGFYQKVDLVKTNVPMEGEIRLLDTNFVQGKNALFLSGTDTTATIEVVFAGYGSKEELEALDVEGKIVVCKFGFKGMNSISKGLKHSREKIRSVTSRGGLGVVELYSSVQLNWSILSMYFNKSKITLSDYEGSELESPYHILIDDSKNKYLSKIEEEGIEKLELEVSGLTPEKVVGKNIIGYIEGSDKNLKDEFVVLSAHYDHVGHTKASMENGEPVDSIFNGARDNAMGTTGLILAAKYFGKVRPNRSILFIGFTAEEKGLLGSEYYSNHPWVSLNKCVFNVNIDCAGYNDTTMVTIFGMAKSTAENKFRTAAAAFGLDAIDDPIPEQRIFERSDHYNFAKHGVPAVLFGPGVSSFDEEIQKYYHQLIDHAETMDFEYLSKVYKAYIKASEDIANDENPPFWVKGDEYENIGKTLYGIEKKPEK